MINLKKASFTIEASIILPILMMIIAAILYFGLYLHDILKLKSSVYSFALVQNKEISSENIEKSFKEYINNQLIISEISNIVLAVDEDCIDIQYKLLFSTPIRIIKEKFFNENEQNHHQRITINNLEKSDFLRKTKALKFWDEKTEE